ncbi:hypothetical protein GobsT_10960 [Gemmata obscuriglobus]|nr:hypothetical protein GobsT_10960 [Gemmata obscuriglobus]VTS01361.1 unnamed protein product [Gemmata obscuriglobus UQM 2246]
MLGMDVLRCKTPALVRKEVWAPCGKKSRTASFGEPLRRIEGKSFRLSRWNRVLSLSIWTLCDFVYLCD